MVAKGYTTSDLVMEELGRDLSGLQLDQAARLIEEAEDIADRETGRSWLAASPTTGELHMVTGRLVYLKNKPVTAITSITRRTLNVGASVATMVAGTDYELIDPANGIVLLSGYPWADAVINTTMTDYGMLLSVTYTSATPVPAGIRRIVTQLVAHWMAKRLSSANQGVRSYSVGGGDLTVTFADRKDVPDEILKALRSYRVMAFA